MAEPLTLCAICGERGIIQRGDHRSPRESYPCPSCRCTLRYRDQATLILDEFGRGQFLDLRKLVASGLLNDVDIYEPALRGPFVAAFKGMPRYRRTFFWEGGATDSEVPFGDLTALDFPDNSFDLVLTSDVMEHVPNPLLAFREIARVLKVGGVHIFSIPTDMPLPNTSVTRARIGEQGIEHLLPAVYHSAGDNAPSLVFTDFGADILDDLSQMGLSTQIVRRSFPADDCFRNATFVSRKLR
jgi:SAM-dependent methyltransferase